MVILTHQSGEQMSTSAVTKLLMLSFVVAQQAFAQAAGDNFQFQLNTPTDGAVGFSSLGLTPWVIALICFALFGIMLATLWPNDSESNPYQRQRKFSRVDQLFFKVTGFILDEEESKAVLKNTRSPAVAIEKRLSAPEQITLVGLSSGGCTFLGDERLKKGQVVVFKLDSLPDFPSKELLAAVKVVWLREEKTHGKRYFVAGGKFVYASRPETSENLRQYLNYLMNEPAT